jgi:NDP-sugar pyrophosphorylase family protein
MYASGKVLLYDKRKAGTDSSMRFIDYGLSILTSDVVSELVPLDRPFDLSDLFHHLSVEGRLAGYIAEHRFYEVGSPTGLADLEEYLAAAPVARVEPHPCSWTKA